MHPSLHVLVVEDSAEDAELIAHELRRGGFVPTLRRVENELQMKEALAAEKWDLILSDFTMPRFDGLSALAVARRLAPETPFILVSGTLGEDAAVVAMKSGATDYIVKSKIVRLPGAVRRELASADERRRRSELEVKMKETVRTSEATRRSLEEQLRQSQKMEAVGRLAGGVAHDFNNLLTVINGFTETIRKGLPADHKLQEAVKEVARAGHRAASLTRQLLTFSRRQLVQPVTMDLNAAVVEMEKMLGRLVNETIVIRMKLNPRPLWVHADPGQIEQVVMNLVVNAQDAMKRGGTLTITTSAEDLRAEDIRDVEGAQDGPHACLAISDTGSGMSPEVLAHIFEPFFTTKKAGEGTGLGLSTVYGIVRQTGGHVTVKSQPGQGSTFRVCLPLKGSSAKMPAVPPPPENSLRGTETILVVEDEPAVRRLAAMFLRDAGYTVLEASRGDEACSLARDAHMVDLVLSDFAMPGMSGRDLAERLNGSGRRYRFLFTSGYADEALSASGTLEPNVPFLQKPFSQDSLLRKVRETLDMGS